MATTMEGQPRPPLDPSMNLYKFMLPVGVLPKTPLVDEYYHDSETDYTEAPHTPRSRSMSNATLDARDVRRSMRHSLTELFVFKIEDPYEPLDFDTRWPFITHLHESFRARDDRGGFYRPRAGWQYVKRPRVITPPRPKRVVSQERGLVDCGEVSLRLFGFFMPIGTQIYLKIFSVIFGEGNPNLNFKALAHVAVHDAVKGNNLAQEEYTKLSEEPLTIYLTNEAPDSWDFDFGHVKSHGLSHLYYKEAVNYGMQSAGEILNNCRIGARVVLYRDSLLNLLSHETIHPPESHPPKILAEQALRLLGKICQLDKTFPEVINANDMRPGLPFFFSNAVKNMMSGIIFGRQLDMFSLGVHYTLKNLAQNQRITPNGIRGRRWFPLNLIALAGTFLIVELSHVAGIEHVAGQEILPTDSLYWFSTFESSIFTVCVNILKDIYDNPDSVEGQALDGVLQLLEKGWNFESHFNFHYDAFKLYAHSADPGEFYCLSDPSPPPVTKTSTK